MRLILLIFISLLLTGCSQPTGWVVTDRVLVKQFDKRMALTKLYYDDPWTCNIAEFIWCEGYSVVSEAELFKKLGYFHRLQDNNNKITDLKKQIINDKGLIYDQDYKPATLFELFISDARALSIDIPVFESETDKKEYLIENANITIEKQERWLREIRKLFEELKAKA